MGKHGSTQQALLQALASCGGRPLSGQALAQQLGVSRSAVWKAARELQNRGYPIQGASGQGYWLAEGNDPLTEQAVRAALPPGCPIGLVEVHEEIDSTNMAAKRLGLAGAPSGTLVVAGRQKQGRGRLGRTFVSPPGGVYLSLLLRPAVAAPDALTATGAAAVAVCRAVEELTRCSLAIKWVNDLFYGGKKVCGILTEAVTDFESGRIDFLVVGIGINLTTTPEQFGPELASIAGSLFPGGPSPCGRAALAASIAAHLLSLGFGHDYLTEYRQRSLVVGHWLTVTGDGDPYIAKALAIDDEGRLVIQLPTGGQKALRFGEVSIRPSPGSL